jgi:hypothetical protein
MSVPAVTKNEHRQGMSAHQVGKDSQGRTVRPEARHKDDNCCGGYCCWGILIGLLIVILMNQAKK